jgi:hypothetical protein
MMKLMRENHSENALARLTPTTSLSSTFSFAFFPFSHTSMLTARSSRVYPHAAMMTPTPSYDIFSSTSAIDEYYNDIGSILDFPTYSSNSRSFSMMISETTESTTPFDPYPINTEPERAPSRHWNGPTRESDQVSPPIKEESSKNPIRKPLDKKRLHSRLLTKSTPKATPPTKRRRTTKASTNKGSSTPQTTKCLNVGTVPETKAPRRASNESSASPEPLEELDSWQKQFLSFLTFPSDHILEATGQLVPFKDTIIWGRQKVLWTAPRGKSEMKGSEKETEAPSFRTSGESSPSQWVNLSSKCGGNHLSHQLVVQAATAAASSSPPDSNAETNFIRRTKGQALWFHGGNHINQGLGLWLRQERESYQATARAASSSPLLNRVTCYKTPRRMKTLSTKPEKPQRKRHPPKDPSFSDKEKEVIYCHLQQSFRFQLMQLSGIDVKNVLPDDTVYPRKRCFPFTTQDKK